MEIYSGDEFTLLSSKLAPEELTCIGYCAIEKCSAQGDCNLEDKVTDIIAEYRKLKEQRQLNAMFIAVPEDDV